MLGKESVSQYTAICGDPKIVQRTRVKTFSQTMTYERLLAFYRNYLAHI